jgi:hypothetical protein
MTTLLPEFDTLRDFLLLPPTMRNVLHLVCEFAPEKLVFSRHHDWQSICREPARRH